MRVPAIVSLLLLTSLASAQRVSQQSVKNQNDEKLSIGASCLVSWECFSMCCTPLPTNQVIPGGQVASCSIRDDGVREALCIQSPEEWDDSSELIERLGLTERIEHLKNHLKIKKKIIINSNTLRNKTSIQQPILPPSPGGLEYPGRRPIFNQLATKDPTAAALYAWSPDEEEESYSLVSTLNQQEPLAVIKSKFQASLQANLTRDGPATDSPASQPTGQLSTTTEVDTVALLEELLSLSNEDGTGTPFVIAPAPEFLIDPSELSTPESSTDLTTSSFETATPPAPGGSNDELLTAFWDKPVAFFNFSDEGTVGTTDGFDVSSLSTSEFETTTTSPQRISTQQETTVTQSTSLSTDATTTSLATSTTTIQGTTSVVSNEVLVTEETSTGETTTSVPCDATQEDLTTEATVTEPTTDNPDCGSTTTVDVEITSTSAMETTLDPVSTTSITEPTTTAQITTEITSTIASWSTSPPDFTTDQPSESTESTVSTTLEGMDTTMASFESTTEGGITDAIGLIESNVDVTDESMEDQMTSECSEEDETTTTQPAEIPVTEHVAVTTEVVTEKTTETTTELVTTESIMGEETTTTYAATDAFTTEPPIESTMMDMETTAIMETAVTTDVSNSETTEPLTTEALTTEQITTEESTTLQPTVMEFDELTTETITTTLSPTTEKTTEPATELTTTEEATTTELTTTEATTTELTTTEEATTTELTTTEEATTTELTTTEEATTTELTTTEEATTTELTTTEEATTTELTFTEEATTTELTTTVQATTELFFIEETTTELTSTEEATTTELTSTEETTTELTTTDQTTTEYITDAPIEDTTIEITTEEITTETVTEEPTSEMPTTVEPTEAPTEELTDAPTEEPTNAPTEVPTNAPTEVPTTEKPVVSTVPNSDVQQYTTFASNTPPNLQELTTESVQTTTLLPVTEITTEFTVPIVPAKPPVASFVFVSSGSSSSGSSSSSSSSDSTITSGSSSPWGALVPIWNAFPVLSIAALIVASPFLLLLTVLFIGTPFGRSIDGGGDLLLGLFNDLYEDRTLDHPWLIAKILSQMFPEEFNPTSSQERMVLTKYVANMFPEQLESLQNWKELSIPSVLIHLLPEKFAQVDYKHLDKYLSDDTVDYTETGNLRLLMLRFLTAAKDNIPEIAQKYITPEVEEKLREKVKNSVLITNIKNVIPDSSNLDNEWLFDRLMFKIKNFKKPGEENEGTTATEPTTQGTTQPETRPTTTSTSPAPKCQWGPILCSINRVSFQRNADKRGDVDSVKVKEIVSRKPKNVPQWLRSSRRKNQTEKALSIKEPRRGPNTLFRRFLFDPVRA